MKFKQLKIQNLASIREAEIDFDAAPLADCSVFLISGRTGSGKTTILDAICLALYNGAPRMKNSEMDGSLPIDNDRSLHVSDCRNLLRRGTAAALVSLSFTGNDGHEYLAEWSVRRARNKVDGNLMPARRCLTDYTEGRSWEKEKEIKTEIIRAVGLDFDQFCRTCMLAQGEFARFLNSSDDSKSAILEKITGVNIYSQIGARIFAVCRQREADLAALKARISEVRCLSYEEIDQYHTELAAISDQLASLSLQRKQFEQQRAWLAQARQLNDKIAQLRPFDSLLQSYRDIVAGMLALRLESTEVAIRISEYTEFFKSRETKRSILENSSAVIDRMRRSDILIEECIDLQKSVDSKMHEIEKSSAILTRKEQNRDRIQQFLTQIEADLVKKEDDIATRKLVDLYKIQAEHNKMLFNIDRVFERIEEQKFAEESISQRRLQLEQKRCEIENIDKQLIELQATERAAAESELQLRSLYEKIRSQSADWVIACRHQLHPGDVCPVCLQKITAPLPSDNEIYQRNIQPVEELWQQSVDKLDVSRTALKNTELTKAALSKSYQSESAQLDKDIQSIQQAANQLNNDLLKWKITAIGAARQALTDIKQNINEQLQAIVMKIAEVEQLNKEAELLRKQYRTVSEQLKLNQSECKTVEDAIAAIRGAVELSRHLIENKISEHQQIEAQIKLDFPVEIWPETIDLSRRQIIDLVLIQADEYAENKQALHNALVLSSSIETKLTSLTRVQCEIEQLRPSFAEMSGTVMPRQKSELEFSMQHLLAELTEQDTLVKQQREHLDNAPQLTDKDTIETLTTKLTDNEQQSLTHSRRQGAIDDILAKDLRNKAHLGALMEELNTSESTLNKWRRLNDIFGSSDGKKFRNIAQSYVLGHLVDIANIYMRGLMPRYTLRVNPGTFIIMVEDSYQNSSLRPASSISGGESFVVSLALALALSDMSGRINLDMLFIDEGFGTLSGESLRRAVDTLHDLHKTGRRRVGIISHVEELKECIDVHINVLPAGRSGASTIEITA